MRRFFYADKLRAEAAGSSLRAAPVTRVYGAAMKNRRRLEPESETVVRPVLQADGRFALIVPDRFASELRARGDADEERGEP